MDPAPLVRPHVGAALRAGQSSNGHLGSRSVRGAGRSRAVTRPLYC
jgi:hypothetical protein